MKISKDIARLILHDSHFEKEVRENNNLVVTFDWAKLENLTELGINEVVILGKTTLKISGIENEQLKAYYEGKKYKLIDFPDNIGNYWNEVQNTKIDGNKKKLQLDGLFSKDGENFWVEWSLNYESCEVEWNSHITLTERKTGYNIGLAIWWLKCFYETFVPKQTLVILMKFSAKNPSLRQTANRYLTS